VQITADTLNADLLQLLDACKAGTRPEDCANALLRWSKKEVELSIGKQDESSTTGLHQSGG
jgi:hypothetical protein